ncbi:protein-L-isoaspartate(D-aspartate) O-methyltransferase [Aminobacter sp. NyZ550]|uniref:protein-L-isoaspartate(D-aspartate) O-methyltransferase n=1 Tax=Aminobacter sp. NyZ550 TaxID=2979870 RepID=UPI0021D60CA1|nr:protein-L-isoaspartate(D-aspartate) O-methyltransferase [Aminobacter sp. NyZ550]WAX96131.1 protein-L-isoaspartate(D-aspartate) O-methyltransferase [Aminobacter sp. NyZ550]
MVDYRAARLNMVEYQIARRGLTEPAVLEAMAAVPREKFVPTALRDRAYDDTALPIAHDQTISQPYIVALMAWAAELERADKVLEIGTGSGYAAAVMARLAGRVVTIERIASLADSARARLNKLGHANVQVITGDGSAGCEAEAPFDAILSAAGSRTVPSAWKEQLAIGGRLIMPLGPFGDQQLVKIVRNGENDYARKTLVAVRFVPLLGGTG